MIGSVYKQHRKEISRILATISENEEYWQNVLEKSEAELKYLQENIKLYEKQEESSLKTFFNFSNAWYIMKISMKRAFKMSNAEPKYKKFQEIIKPANAYVQAVEQLSELYCGFDECSERISQASYNVKKLASQRTAVESMIETENNSEEETQE